MELDLAAADVLSLQPFAESRVADPWADPPVAIVPSDDHDSDATSGTDVSPVEAEATLPQSPTGATLPLLEDELVAELAAFSLHTWFDDLDSDLRPPLIARQSLPLTIAPTPISASTAADTTSTNASGTSGTSGTGVSPVGEESSATEPTSTFLVSGSFAAVSTETAAGPVIASMTLTRATDWQREGGTATVSVEVYNGTGSAVAAGEYWVSFFVDRGVEGITVPEPNHAVPALAPGETTDVPAVATDVVVASGAERELYHLRAALMTNPNAPPRDPAPLLVEAVSDLSIQWTAHTSGGVQAMGGGQGGGVPTVDSLDLTPYSIWTEIDGSAYATANVCNNSGAPIIDGEYEVDFSVDLNPPGIDPPDPLPVPGLEDNSCAPVPPWGGTPFDVHWFAATGTYTARATIPNASTNTHLLHVVAVNDWMVEWENPPGSGSWSQPDGTIPGPPAAEYLWTHDTRRWTALGISHPALVTSIDWLARPAGGGAWMNIASATGNNPAYGDSLAEGDWEITPEVHFQGQGSAQMAAPKRFVLAKIESLQWDPHTVSEEAGDLLPDGGNFRFFPDADAPGGGYWPKVDLLVDVTPDVAGINVLFDTKDVDDPSDDDGPIDADPPICTNPPQPGQSDTNPPDNLLDGYNPPVSEMTDNGGNIRTTFTLLAFHPGNNYRLAAAHRQSELDAVKAFSRDGDGWLYQDLDGNDCLGAGEPLFDHTVPPPGVGVSPMLTVWRKLHVEVDSMGPVGNPPAETNIVTGEIMNVNSLGAGQYELTTNQSLDDSQDRFHNGVLNQNGHLYNVISSSTGNNFTVRVEQGAAPAPVVGPFTSLVDDDFLKDPQDVPMPDTSTLGAAMADAFVSVVFDVDNDQVPFILNVGNSVAAVTGAQDWDSKDDNSESFWVAYVLGAFQGDKDFDYDPDAGNAHLGDTPNPQGGSVVYLETIRDRSKHPVNALNEVLDAQTLERDAVVHEVGHAVGDSGIEPVTGSTDTDPNTQPSEYLEIFLLLIRLSDKPRSP